MTMTMRWYPIGLIVLLASTIILDNTASVVQGRVRITIPNNAAAVVVVRPPRTGLAFCRGGAQSSSSSTKRVNPLELERYVAAVEEQDAADDINNNNEEENKNDQEASASASGDSSSSSNKAHHRHKHNKHTSHHPDDDNDFVSVKQHNTKKSNAVGDPDGNSSDDTDDDTDDTSEWEEFLEEIEELQQQQQQDNDAAAAAAIQEQPKEPTTTQVQVELELVEELETPKPTTSSAATTTTAAAGSSGVGVRLANRLSRRNSQKQQQQQQQVSTTNNNKSNKTKERRREKALQQAWSSHIYFPPSTSGQDYLETHARTMDANSKSRLDRRTLYGALMLEWGRPKTKSSPSYTSRRKFLDAPTSQSLQAALSLATQPKWRQSFPQANCISLTAADDKSCTTTTTTLGMQETIAMAMAHSLGCGMVILDDDVLANVQTELQQQQQQSDDDDVEEQDIKPASLLKALLSMAHDGKLQTKSGKRRHGASIAACMEKELTIGLDDPFDERAVSSCNDMIEWEKHWSTDDDETDKEEDAEKETDNKTVDASSTTKKKTSSLSSSPLPLVIFVRTEASSSLLKSKSAVERLLQECTSSDSNHLIVLGKGIDATTETLPQEPDHYGDGDSSHHHGRDNMMGVGSGLPSPGTLGNPVQPLFGFSEQNQNASGQNDPEGSRRFNIFLARTTDRHGTPGFLGAVAPPQAGNLFPHMMALQARERLQEQGRLPPPDSADSSSLPLANKAELEQWSQLLQQQMQSQGQIPFPSPQFFNATSLVPKNPFMSQQQQQQQQQPNSPPPEVVQRALQQAMTELLDRLAQMSEDDDNNADTSSSGAATPSELHPDLHIAFAQVLRNENFRRSVAENLLRAAPALADPKCLGVMLSVYVPPPPHHFNSGKLPGQQQQQSSSSNNEPSSKPQNQGSHHMGGWFQKILNSHDMDSTDNNVAAESTEENGDQVQDSSSSSSSSSRKSSRKHRDRVRTLAAAKAMVGMKSESEDDEQQQSGDKKSDSTKVERNLAKLETLCRHIAVKTPLDPVRAKSWDAWIARERGAVVFRHNRRALNSELAHRRLLLEQRTGTRGVGSSLRQMLSVRDVSDEMEDVIKCAVELEAAKSQRHQIPTETTTTEENYEIDVSLHQLLVNDDGVHDSVEVPTESSKQMQFLHPASLESALTLTCRLNPSPSGGLSLSSSAEASHRSREDIMALAQDKHERALVSQVVSPQDIGVTYDMIGGLTDVKELLRQSITYPLKFPHLYSEGIAREAVKGVLLFGPPGTGKTMLAKAVATEGGASFLSVDASSVENKWLGESEKNAKAVFTLARRLAPCVIFIDEVDSLLSSREGSSDDSAHGTLTSVKTTMMSEWDGLNSGTNGSGEAGSDRVVVIGSTNRPFDLDEAVLRRFPRRILVDLPDLETRKEILEVTLAENRLDPAVNLTLIAERLEGYTGSDIKEVCREAVVQISHEQARLADQGGLVDSEGEVISDFAQGSLQRLRPVRMDDFEKALGKLKRSVSESGRELSRVWEWNDEYGEIKREKRDHLPQLMNMFL